MRNWNEKDGAVVRALLGIAADWSAYDLAQDEYKAPAVVQKAREMAGVLAEAEEREKAAHDEAARERAEQHKIDHELMQRRETALLLAQFDQASIDGGDPQSRGYLLQDLLGRLFVIHEIPVVRAFQRNSGAGTLSIDQWLVVSSAESFGRIARRFLRFPLNPVFRARTHQDSRPNAARGSTCRRDWRGRCPVRLP